MIDKLFKILNKEFEFNLDAAANIDNARCRLFITENDNAFSKKWNVFPKTKVWLYPPAGREYKKWAKKASEQNCIVVGLFPATTEADWFRDHIFNKAEVRFINKRLKNSNEEANPTKGSMIVIWGLPACFKIMEVE